MSNNFLQDTLCTLYQPFIKPPHHGALSTIKFQVALLLVKYLCTSSKRVSFTTPLEAAWNVLALSLTTVVGSPRRAEKRRKASRKLSTSSRFVNSRCNPPVEAQVNKHLYTFLSDCPEWSLACKVQPYMRKWRIIRNSCTGKIWRHGSVIQKSLMLFKRHT